MPSPYGSRRGSRRVPRWLVLLMAGVVLGAGGLLFVQHNYGPRQLTVEESNKLLNDLNSVTLERQSLQAQLSQFQQQRDQSQAAQQKATADLAQANDRLAILSKTLQILQDAVPPDPHGGNIGVRWGELNADGGIVNYRTLVMRQQTGAQPAFQGQLVIDLAGTRGGRAYHVVSPAFSFSLDRFAPLQGVITLPDDFVPRQATLRVIDAQGRVQASRIYLVHGTTSRNGN